jgi:2'-5' RNA ligase
MLRQQLSLPGLERAKALDFLFFAALPSPTEAPRFALAGEHLRRELGLGGRLLAQETLHVSLHAIGEYDGLPNSIVESAKKAGAAVLAPPCEIVFNNATSFNRRTDRPLVLRAGDDPPAFMILHRVLGDAMKSVGFRRVSFQFTPHMTLLYDHRLVAKRAIKDIRLTVQNFDLVHSLHGRGPTRYIHLARWSLRG